MTNSNSIILQSLSTEQLSELMGDVFETKFEAFKKNLNTHNPDELLSRAEACEFLKIEQTTLYRWQKAGKIKLYGLGNRRFLKKAELMECLILKK